MEQNMTDEVAVGISLDINEILFRIPHRYPFLLVDRAEDYIPGVSITGIKAVTFNDPSSRGTSPTIPSCLVS